VLGFGSRSQIDKLGDRLAKKAIPDESDLQQLQRLRAAYDEPMAAVARIVREELGLQATSRLKTVNTIIDKLKRDRTRLSSMQDIAGLRIVKDVTLPQQDEISRIISEAFPGAKVVDRRRHPSHGYRAVHVIVEQGECLVEVQVRTRLQDLWAQALEKAADSIGREIRYGTIPGDEPQRSMVEMLMEMSEMIDSVENQLARAEETENAFEGRPSQDEEYLRLRVMNQMQKDRLEVTRGGLSQLLERLLGVLRDQK